MCQTWTIDVNRYQRLSNVILDSMLDVPDDAPGGHPVDDREYQAW